MYFQTYLSPLRVYGLACLSFLVLTTPYTVANAEEKLPYCWTDKELKVKAGDSKIRMRIPAAFQSPPIGTPSKAHINAELWKQARGKVIRRVILPKGVKKIAITFDLCEQPHEVSGYQGSMIDLLRKENVKATFFAGGKWMITHPSRAQQLMADPLFEMANHSWEHRNLRLLKGTALSNSIERAQLAYSTVRKGLETRKCLNRENKNAVQQAASQMSLLRFPFGACNKRAMKAVGDAGLLSIQWDVSAADPVKGQTANRIKRAVLGNVKPGSIVIFHANGRGWHTPKALPEIITALKKRGYEFVSVTELLNTKDAKLVIKDSCYDHHPGDSERYDKLGHRLHAFYKRISARHYASNKLRGKKSYKARNIRKTVFAARQMPRSKKATFPHSLPKKKSSRPFRPFQGMEN